MKTRKPAARPKIKRAKFIQGIIEGKSQAQAAREAGYSEVGLGSHASRLMQHPDVQAALEKHLAEHDLGVNRVASELDHGLKTGTKGKHSDYVAMLMRIHKIGEASAAPGGPSMSVNIFSNETAYEAFLEFTKRRLANAANQQGRENNVVDAEPVRSSKRQVGFLREPQQGDDLGSGEIEASQEGGAFGEGA